MHKALHLTDDIDWRYVPRKQGGRKLASIEDSVNASKRRLQNYIKKIKERLIIATRNSAGNIMINWMIITTKQKWEEEQLYGYFKRQAKKISQDLNMPKKEKL